jgi:hypothetical protein
MNDKVNKLGAGYVWLFALGAVLLGAASAYATAGLGAKVSSAVYFAIFLFSGFGATVLTKANALVSAGVFLLASIVSAAAYYWVTMQTMADAANALGAADAGGMLGAALGIFVAIVTFGVSASGGVGGVIAGSRVKKQLLGA